MVMISALNNINILVGIAALIVLVFTADKVMQRIIDVAHYLKVSKLFIGLTVVSIGTSFPEIITHIVGSIDILKGNLDRFIISSTVLGTNIGSDIIQQNFVIGVVALIGAITLTKKFLKRDFLIMIFTAVILLAMCLDKQISRIDGFILAAGYILYLYMLFKEERTRRKNHQTSKELKQEKRNLTIDFTVIIIGLAVLLYSAEYILTVSQFFVVKYNISGSLIGIVIIGIATALPELSTSISAALKKQAEISAGTLIGSNITNPALAVGIGAMISGYDVPNSIIIFDLPVKIITAVIIFYFFWKHNTLKKEHAIIMILLYIAYIFIRIKFFSVDI